MTRKGYITIAFGSEKYLEVARNLARSIKLNAPGLPLAIVTDLFDADLSDFDVVIPTDPSGGRTLFHKLALDLYTPFDETIFLDSDCFVTRNMDSVWEAFTKHEFGVVGEQRVSGEWFGTDIAAIRDACAIAGSMPKFNSGFIYWESGDLSDRVFAEAREMWSQYESIGLGQFRDTMFRADEPILSIGMARHGVQAMPDPGTVMNTPIGIRGRMRINLLSATCSFNKDGRVVRPAVAHFCGFYRDGGYYRREAAFLSWSKSGTRHRRVARLLTTLLFLPLTALDTSRVWEATRATYRFGRRLYRGSVAR